jgi:hypothetical protein
MLDPDATPADLAAADPAYLSAAESVARHGWTPKTLKAMESADAQGSLLAAYALMAYFAGANELTAAGDAKRRALQRARDQDDAGSPVGAWIRALLCDEPGEALAAARRADQAGSRQGSYVLGILLTQAGDLGAALDAFSRGAQRGEELAALEAAHLHAAQGHQLEYRKALLEAARLASRHGNRQIFVAAERERQPHPVLFVRRHPLLCAIIAAVLGILAWRGAWPQVLAVGLLAIAYLEWRCRPYLGEVLPFDAYVPSPAESVQVSVAGFTFWVVPVDARMDRRPVKDVRAATPGDCVFHGLVAPVAVVVLAGLVLAYGSSAIGATALRVWFGAWFGATLFAGLVWEIIGLHNAGIPATDWRETYDGFEIGWEYDFNFWSLGLHGRVGIHEPRLEGLIDALRPGGGSSRKSWYLTTSVWLSLVATLLAGSNLLTAPINGPVADDIQRAGITLTVVADVLLAGWLLLTGIGKMVRRPWGWQLGAPVYILAAVGALFLLRFIAA